MPVTLKTSKIQEQFWLANNIYSRNIAYNVPMAFRLSKVPDIPNLEKAIHLIIQKYEVLRASFTIENGRLIQIIHGLDELDTTISCQYRQEMSNSELINSLVSEEANFCFDLNQFPLFRITLINFSDNKAALIIVFHHIIIDLTSRDLFCEELSTYYNELQKSDLIEISVSKYQYINYTEWLEEWMKSSAAQKKLEYWKEKYSGTEELLNLPTDNQKTIRKSLYGKQKQFGFGDNLTSKIKDYSQKKSISEFMFLFSAYTIFLHRLCDQNKIIVGVPHTNRNRHEDQSTIGCFVNTLPISVDFTNDPSFLELIHQIRQEFLFAHRNQQVPFLEIINSINKSWDRSSNPIYQVGFTNEPMAYIELENIDLEPLVISKNGAQLDLFFKLYQHEKSLNATIEYNSELFEDETIDHWIDIFKEVINSIFESETIPVSKLNILSISEEKMIFDWNETEVSYEKYLCVHQKLELMAHISPELIALRFGESVLSYHDLNNHSNKLANYLISKGVNIEDIIAICLDRSFEMMIGIFAILKAGATFLPLDPKFPHNRLSEIMNDACPKFVLTTSNSDLNLPTSSSVIYIDNILLHPLTENDRNPECKVESQHLAYITYTSGSTGKPKGVMIEHHSLMNRLNWMQKKFPITPDDVLVQKTSITFDVSVWELFWWSFVGASLAILPPGAEREPNMIIHEIKTKKITVIHFVPSMFSVFVGYLKASKQILEIVSLKWIFASGEALTPKMVNDFNKLRVYSELPEVINLYGPTEATIDVSCYRCPNSDTIKEIPIGKTIDNTKLFIINKSNGIQPWGIPGELIIAGVNLARGYCNNLELTNKKFPTIEFKNGSKIRIYKTGDLAKWNSDGNIIFIGRMDNQVKIRGFRIELGEIETKILKYPKIKETSVLFQPGNNNNPILKAFIVPYFMDQSITEELKKFLLENLPVYMVPSQIYIIDKMPISQNGKIDKKALNEIIYDNKREIAQPASAIEQSLIQLYKGLLDLKSICITDNFFDLGGNSLLAIQLTSKLHEEFKIPIEVVKVFEFPNIKELASYLITTSSEKKNINAKSKRNLSNLSHKNVIKRNY